MDQDKIAELRQYSFMKSRIPALDALSIFVPTGKETDSIVQEMTKQVGMSRWYPVSGGQKVLFPYEKQSFDTKFFQIEKKAWDHEHCKLCGESIPAMTLCWVTEQGPYILLCVMCYKKVKEDQS